MDYKGLLREEGRGKREEGLETTQPHPCECGQN